MSLETFIKAMPKVDLYVQFEGALHKELMMLIAEENDIIATMKSPRQFYEMLSFFDKPDQKRGDDIVRTWAGWIQQPEDLTRAVYEVGLMLHKDNVRYAEVAISPAYYTDLGMTFETFLDAINDGRDRLWRAWQIKLNWILTIPRDRPRKGDDIARWATTATARKGNVVALGLTGREDAQPVGQFAKPFAAAKKKELAIVAHARSQANTEPLREIFEAITPSRIVDPWFLADDPSAEETLSESRVPLVVSPTRELRLGRIANYAAYPFRRLIDNYTVVLGTSMPVYYKTSLSHEYLMAAQYGELGADEIETLALNAVRASFLSEDEQDALLTQFTLEYAKLREANLVDA